MKETGFWDNAPRKLAELFFPMIPSWVSVTYKGMVWFGGGGAVSPPMVAYQAIFPTALDHPHIFWNTFEVWAGGGGGGEIIAVGRENLQSTTIDHWKV